MQWPEVLTIIGSILIPMFGGFVWIISRIDRVERDITDLKVQVAKLEIQTDIKTIKVIHSTGTEPPSA